MKALSIFIIYKICHLDCHCDTIAAVCDGCHSRGRTTLIQFGAPDYVILIVSLGVEVDNQAFD